ncbi:extracellular calcium-sensing receptor-like [Rhinatrema bivittatum]|uniref:extracellular calcium-sensing receptor-like n=1 Tax=Rhinatrema bivittatum TaxID=194408 RepID=UPI00112C3BB4|nr:extracellular calcium-sensing receptor-like [Rhinatrema bivittatum]
MIFNSRANSAPGTLKFWVHRGVGFSFRSYRWVLAMLFAITEINKSPTLLPNVTLGFRILDTCNAIERALRGTLQLMSGPGTPTLNYQCQNSTTRLGAVIGDSGSAQSVPMAWLLGLYHIPQIGYFTPIPSLSDKHTFPSFLSVAPGDYPQAYGLSRLIAHFGWTWVGILAQDGDYGQLSSQILTEEISKAGACVAFSEIVPLIYSGTRIRQIVQVVRKSLANVIVVFSLEAYLNPVMEEISALNLTGRVWIATEAWSTSPSLSNQNLFRTLSGTIGLVIRNGKMPGFKDFVFSLQPSRFPNDTFVKLFWQEAFRCTWLQTTGEELSAGNEIGTQLKPCSGIENLANIDIYSDIDDLRVTYNVYKACYAAAHALQNLLSCQDGQGLFANRICATMKTFEPWQLLHHMRKIHFKGNLQEDLYFDAQGNTPAVYDIINWQLRPNSSVTFVKVGAFDSSAPRGQELLINDNAVLWNKGDQQVPHSKCSESCQAGYRKISRRGEPACCFDCTLCSPGEINNQIDSTECFKCPSDHWSNHARDRCIPKEVEFLSYAEPLGATLATMAVTGSMAPLTILAIFLKHQDTAIVKANNRALSYLLLLALTLCFLCPLVFIGQPQVVTCMLRQATFGVIFTFGISCLLAKTILVVIAFKATKPHSHFQKWVGPQIPGAIVFLCTSLQAILCIFWVSSYPPFPDNNMKSQLGKIIMECNEGSSLVFWFMLGYMGFLAGVSFLVAFLARKLPDSFNEAKLITFSMLVFGSVWASFVPAYLSTRGKYMVAVEIFTILASSAGLVSCIFIPKCYVILLRPERNTRGHLMGKKTVQIANIQGESKGQSQHLRECGHL